MSFEKNNFSNFNSTSLETISNSLRKHIEDYKWLPKYKETRQVVELLTDDMGQFQLGDEEFERWSLLLKNPKRPIFEIWTQEYIEAFSNYLEDRINYFQSKYREEIVILEVGAGDGRLSYFLQGVTNKSNIHGTKIIATNMDSSHFEIDAPFDNVINIEASDALAKFSPTIVICSWMMHGVDWTPLFRQTQSVEEYILIGPEGPCGTEETWEKFSGFSKIEHDNLKGLQLSRLDILYGPRKVFSKDLITGTSSFVRMGETVD